MDSLLMDDVETRVNQPEPLNDEWAKYYLNIFIMNMRGMEEKNNKLLGEVSAKSAEIEQLQERIHGLEETVATWEWFDRDMKDDDRP